MISRSPSGNLRTNNPDNMATALNQKDKMIQLLKRELDGFRSLKQDYERLRDRKTFLLDKCDAVNREIALNRESQKRKADSDIDMVQDISTMVLSLEKEFQNKSYQFKTLKCQTQTLLNTNEQKQSDLNQCLDVIEATKTYGETLKMERDRIRIQLGEAEDQISRVRHKYNQSIGSYDKLRNQIHNTQSYITNLENEDQGLENNLSAIEDENNALDGIIDDLSNLIQTTKLKTRDMKLNKEAIQMKIKAKQLEKGRIQTEFCQKQKQLKSEKDKQRRVKEQVDAKKNQMHKLSQMKKQVCDEMEDILSKNLSIQGINSQLKNDLDICKRHLENVLRTNCSIKDDLESYKRTNLVVIKKIKNCMQSDSVQSYHHLKTEFAQSTSDNFMLRL